MDAASLQAALARFLNADGGSLLQALAALPLAAVLGTILAFRPRRRGTPPRSSPVIQTQIILAVVGAVVMLIVGASLARAFGIVGAANLIRYRAQIHDPEDAVVMLSTLSLGLACGVQLYGLAVVATLFVLGLLWAVESLEPEQRKTFDLSVTTPDPPAQQRTVEAILRRHRIQYELRSAGDKELVYEAEMPVTMRLDNVSDAILHLQPDAKQGETQVVWNEKKKK